MAKRTQKKSYLGTILLSRRAMRAIAAVHRDTIPSPTHGSRDVYILDHAPDRERQPIIVLHPDLPCRASPVRAPQHAWHC